MSKFISDFEKKFLSAKVTKIKLSLFIITIAMIMLVSNFNTKKANAAGIPVVDGASIAQDAANFMQTIAHYAQTLMEMQRQYEQQIKHYKSMTDVRGMMNVLNSYYDTLMEIETSDVLKDFGIVDPATLGLGDGEADYKRASDASAIFLSSVIEMQEQNLARYEDLMRAVKKVDKLKDPKDALDLQARIQAEQTLLQNETMKINLLQQRAQAERMMQEQKALQTHIDIANKPPVEKW